MSQKREEKDEQTNATSPAKLYSDTNKRKDLYKCVSVMALLILKVLSNYVSKSSSNSNVTFATW